MIGFRKAGFSEFEFYSGLQEDNCRPFHNLTILEMKLLSTLLVTA